MLNHHSEEEEIANLLKRKKKKNQNLFASFQRRLQNKHDCFNKWWRAGFIKKTEIDKKINNDAKVVGEDEI